MSPIALMIFTGVTLSDTMSPVRSVGSVIVGTVVTLALGGFTIVLLPFLGFATGEVAGNWLPIWVFAFPLVLCATVGGATTGFLQGIDRKRGAILGSLAGGLGFAVVGIVFGFLFLVIMLGMTPAHGQETNLSRLTIRMTTVGGGSGFAVGALFGAIGGAGGHVGRQELDP